MDSAVHPLTFEKVSYSAATIASNEDEMKFKHGN